MKPKIRICLLLFMVCGALAFGQEDDFIRGTLVDKNTNAPVVFATIRLQEKAIGVISNQDGGFRIPQRFMNLGETLVISCLGYKKKKIRLSDLSPDFNTTIRLEPQPLELQEAVLVGRRKKPPSPRQIIKRAIERIPRNYPTVPFAYVGYYRDYQLKENEYINLNEALLHITDMGFGQNDLDHTKIQMYDYKANRDFKRDSIADNPYDYRTQQKIIKNAFLHDFGGNEFNILRIHDPIRNYDVNTFSFVNRLNKDLLRNHSFSRQRDAEINGKRMYVVQLEKDQPRNDEDGSFENNSNVNFRSVYGLHDPSNLKRNSAFKAVGRFYVAQSTYAIHKFEYTLYDFNGPKTRKSKNEDAENLIFELALGYEEHNGKMYLNYISFHNVFKVNRSYFKVEKIVLDLERKCFVIRANKPPIFFVEQGEPNIHLKYRKKKMGIREIINTQNGILVYPEESAIEEIIADYHRAGNAATPAAMERFFEFDFVNIKDVDGNLLNSFVFEEYHQFREFFTQQLVRDTIRIPPIEAIMKKDRPIFKDQPIVRPDNFDEFWMNTPLQSRQ